MTREEENRKVTDRILRMNGKEADFKTSLLINENMIVSLLIDISKSLAIQANAAVEANKQKKDMDEEKPHGHWIEMMSPTGSIWECSECGDDVSEQDTFIFSFCPFCGADMRKKDDEG